MVNVKGFSVIGYYDREKGRGGANEVNWRLIKERVKSIG